MEMISLGMWVAGLFGKTPAAAAARKIGLAVAVVGGLLLAALLIWGGIKLHDRGVISVYQDKTDAAIANATVQADRDATANALDRANVSEAENERLQNAVDEAKAIDPDKGTRVVGNVSQSYFDNLPTKKGK